MITKDRLGKSLRYEIQEEMETKYVWFVCVKYLIVVKTTGKTQYKTI